MPPELPQNDPLASEITRLLQLPAERRETDRLLELVYGELRRLAASQMARESGTPTLEPTALVHEAWLRLVHSGSRNFEGRVHFFRTAARAMRRILIDRARRAQVARRADAGEVVTLDAATPGIGEPSASRALDLIDLADALDALEGLDPRLSEIVAMRWLAGLSVDETAEALELSTRTVKREWSVAKAWLADRLGAA